MKKTVIIDSIKPAFTDERGTITDLLNEDVAHVGLIVTEKNAVRASHYHRKSRQYSYILSGSFEVLTAARDQPESVEKHVVKAGELITIAPGTIHRFRALNKATMIDMISQSRAGTAYEDDVVRVAFEDGTFVLPVTTRRGTKKA
jgi:quercetin dioxygenase-like cupin family protein